jgi:radical SAM superfamily enzyme YgiQ (UPF0313 family)
MNSKVVLVELPATPNGGLFEEPAKDVYSFFYLPSRAIDLLKGILEAEGFHHVTAINPRHNPGREVVTEEQLRTIVSADVVGISTITRTVPQSFELADYVREKNPGAVIVFGGPHVTALPEEALEHCDYVVRNEGDITFPELLKRIEAGSGAPEVEDVLGISYRKADGTLRHNGQRPFLTPEELTELPLPVYSEDTLAKSAYITVNTSRGCPYKCEFCSVVTQFGSTYRAMSIDRTIEYLQYIISLKRGKKKFSIFFGDDHFGANISRTKELLRRILTDIPDMPRWTAQVRVETASDPELLSLMKQAGCFKVYIGFESIDEQVLKEWNKHQNRKKIVKAIQEYHKAGITIHGMFVFGSDYDTPKTVLETTRFANRYNIDTMQSVSLLPLPGTPLAAKYEKAKKILTKQWALYSGHQVIIKPALMKPKELQQAIIRGVRRFYSVPQIIKQFFRFNLGTNWKSNISLRIIGTLLRLAMIREIRGRRTVKEGEL